MSYSIWGESSLAQSSHSSISHTEYALLRESIPGHKGLTATSTEKSISDYADQEIKRNQITLDVIQISFHS